MQTGAMLNIVSQNPMTVSMRTIDGGGPAEATADSIVIDLDDTASVTLSDVRIDASELFLPALWVYDGALNLELAGEGSLESGGNIAGLQNDGNPLTISGDGSLEAEGGGVGGAGIGGGYDGAGSNITIMGGTIRATGGTGAAGIGGGRGGTGSDITISGGFIDAKGEGGAQAIGGGAGEAASSIISITGGCFADSAQDLADVSDVTARGTVYGIAVPDTSKVGDGYAVTENPDGETKGDYPITVVPARVQEAGLSLAEGAGFTYDGDPIEADPFEISGGTGKSFEHRAAGAADCAPWADGLPADAGDWRVRATVGFAKSGYVAGDKLFYFTDHDLTNEVEVTVGRAPLTVTAKDATVAFSGTPAFSAKADGWVSDREQAELEEGLLGSLAYATADADGDAYSADAPAGSEFTVTPSLKDGAQLDAGMANYELSFKPGALAVVQSASEVAPDEGSAEQTVTYGESATVKGTVAATGEAPAQSGLLAAIMSLAVPAEDQVALFEGEKQLTEPTTVDGDGRFFPTYDTATRALPADMHTLEMRYTGTADRADAVAEVTLTIEPKQLTVAWGNHEGRRHLDGKGDVTCEVTGVLKVDVASGSVRWAVSGADAASGDPGERTATVALDVNEGGFYALGDDAELAYTVDPAKTELSITSFDEAVTYGDRLSAEVTLMVGEGADRQVASAEEVRLSFQGAGDAAALELTATTDAEGSARASYDTTLKDVPVGAVALTASFAGRGSYGPCASEHVEVTVEPLAVSARVAGSAAKVYDGTDAAPADGLRVELAGVLEGDDVPAAAASYAFDSAGATATRRGFRPRSGVTNEPVPIVTGALPRWRARFANALP